MTNAASRRMTAFYFPRYVLRFVLLFSEFFCDDECSLKTNVSVLFPEICVEICVLLFSQMCSFRAEWDGQMQPLDVMSGYLGDMCLGARCSPFMRSGSRSCRCRCRAIVPLPSGTGRWPASSGLWLSRQVWDPAVLGELVDL